MITREYGKVKMYNSFVDSHYIVIRARKKDLEELYMFFFFPLVKVILDTVQFINNCMTNNPNAKKASAVSAISKKSLIESSWPFAL